MVATQEDLEEAARQWESSPKLNPRPAELLTSHCFALSRPRESHEAQCSGSRWDEYKRLYEKPEPLSRRKEHSELRACGESQVPSGPRACDGRAGGVAGHGGGPGEKGGVLCRVCRGGLSGRAMFSLEDRAQA